MLEAIARGKPVVTHLWLESCGQAGCLIDERNFILRDDKKEKELGFNMAASLANARQYPILKVIARSCLCLGLRRMFVILISRSEDATFGICIC